MSDFTALETNVRVFTRVRPLLPKEKLNGEESCVRVTSDLKQVIVGKDRGFTFDGVFNQISSQESVYQSCVADLVKNIFDGYNSTIFAYGQTGSGKTYTMGTFNQNELLNDEKGIVPRAVEHIFKIIAEKREKVNITVTASFIEVYKEEVRDLLDPMGCNAGQDGCSIQIREDDRGNTILCGVYEHQCESHDELLECLDLGSANRVTGATQMNEHSSRSHCVFTVNVVQEWSSPCLERNDDTTEYSESEGKNEIRNVILGKFHFVDLAGSERAHKTGNVGDRFKESIHINSGLLALGNVISALGDPKKKKLSHIPYRESKITRILKDSLGGNARTLMICCISPAVSNYDETVNALKYANRARNIRNKPIVNRDHTTRQIVQMQSEIIALREQLSRQKGEFPIQDDQNVDEGGAFQIPEKTFLNSKVQMIKFQTILLKAKDIISSQIDLLCKGNNEISYDLLTRIEEWVTISEDVDFSELEQGVQPYTDLNVTFSADKYDCSTLIKENINKLRNDLINNVDLHAQKSNELLTRDKCIYDLEKGNSEMKSEVNSLLVRLREYESRLVEQHRELTQCRRELRKHQQSQSNSASINMQYNFSAAPQTSPIKDQDCGPRIKSVPLSVTKDKRIQSSKSNPADIVVQRKIKSSPHVINPELMVSRFHAQSQFLMTELENDDEVMRPKFDDVPDENGDISLVAELPDRQLNKFSRQGARSSVLDHCSKEESTFSDRLEEAFHTTDVYKKQIKISQLKLTDAHQKLRDLSINIRLKEQLIKDLMKSSKDTGKVNKDHEEKIKNLEIEKEQTNRDVEKLQTKLDELSSKSKDNETAEVKKIKEDYQRRMEQAQRKLTELQRKQKETQKLAAVTSNYEKKVNDLVITVERSKQEQINMQKKLKLENDIKQKLEKDLQRDQERIKQLEIQNEQQQKILKRKQEEVVAANRKLRRGSTSMSSNEAINKPEDQKKWLDEELEKIIQHKKQIDGLEIDLKKREEILNKRENLLIERSEICASSNKTDERECSAVSDTKSTTLTVERDNLRAKKLEIEEKVKAGKILSDKEERWVTELDEAIEVLDEAIQYKNESIQSKQEECRRSQYNIMMSREDIFIRLTQVGADESRQLLMRYFDKVIDLREDLRKKELTDYEKEMQIDELQRFNDQLQRNIERQVLEYDRRYTQLQTNLESEKQVLLHQMATYNTSASSVDDNVVQREFLQMKVKCQNLEKESYIYKKTCREMKSKIREWVLSGRLKADIDITDLSQIPVITNSKIATGRESKDRVPNVSESRTIQSKVSVSMMSISNELPSQKSYDPENYIGSVSGLASVKSSQIQTARNSGNTKKSLVTYSSADPQSSGNYVKNDQVTKLLSLNKKINDKSPMESMSTSIIDSLDENMK